MDGELKQEFISDGQKKAAPPKMMTLLICSYAIMKFARFAIKAFARLQLISQFLPSLIAACAAASLAIGTRNGEQET